MGTFSYETAVSELIEHPLLTTIKFVFADYRPNGNKQAVSLDEFENIATSAIGMPIKINFIRGLIKKGSSNHPGSTPIGHIRHMETIDAEDGSHQLIAEAAIWKEEFPEVVKWLKDAWDKGEPPGLSWELKYKRGKLIDGVEWLQGVVAAAATFVEHPAYGPRTTLLALASIQNPEDYGDEMAQSLIALAEQLKSAPKEQPKPKGGKPVDEEELKKVQAELSDKVAEAASKQSEIEKLLADIATKDGEISTLQDQVASLEKSALIDDRVRKYTETVGMLPAEASESDKKKNLFASFSEEQFDDYLSELAALKKSLTPDKSAAASLRARASLDIPKIEVPVNDNPTLETLRNGLRSIARPNRVE